MLQDITEQERQVRQVKQHSHFLYPFGIKTAILWNLPKTVASAYISCQREQQRNSIPVATPVQRGNAEGDEHQTKRRRNRFNFQAYRFCAGVCIVGNFDKYKRITNYHTERHTILCSNAIDYLVHRFLKYS